MHMKPLPDILSEGLLTSKTVDITIHDLLDALTLANQNNGDPRILLEIYKFIKRYLEDNYEGTDEYREYDVGDDDIEEIYNWMDLKLMACVREGTAPESSSKYEYIVDFCVWSLSKVARNIFRLKIVADKRSGELVNGYIFLMPSGEYKLIAYLVEQADMVYDMGLRVDNKNKKLIDFCKKNLKQLR